MGRHLAGHRLNFGCQVSPAVPNVQLLDRKGRWKKRFQITERRRRKRCHHHQQQRRKQQRQHQHQQHQHHQPQQQQHQRQNNQQHQQHEQQQNRQDSERPSGNSREPTAENKRPRKHEFRRCQKQHPPCKADAAIRTRSTKNTAAALGGPDLTQALTRVSKLKSTLGKAADPPEVAAEMAALYLVLSDHKAALTSFRLAMKPSPGE